jgi:hypothetical protein
MQTRAQGAMEYLMTYGWAILVIMIVGVVMWQLGIFHMGVIPPTASGFPVMKPLLATSQIRNDTVWGPYHGNGEEYYGFATQLVNSAGADIYVENLQIFVNGRVCKYAIVSLDSAWTGDGTTSYANFHCDEGATFCDFTYPTCSCRAYGIPCGTAGSIPRFPIKKDSQFTVAALSWVNRIDGMYKYGVCGEGAVPGEPYTVEIEITYVVNVGGVESTKTDRGVIRVAGT